MFWLQDKHCKESHYKILSFLHMSFLKMEQKPAKKITEHWTMFNTGKQTRMQNLELFWQCSVLAKNHCNMWAFNFLQIIEKNVSNWFIVSQEQYKIYIMMYSQNFWLPGHFDRAVVSQFFIWCCTLKVNTWLYMYQLLADWFFKFLSLYPLFLERKLRS